MNVLITGGAGFIGTHLAESCKMLGYNVTILDNYTEQIHGKNAATKSKEMGHLYNHLVGDVRTSDIEKALWISKADVVFHLAAETGTSQSMDERCLHCGTNVLGTANLLDAIQKTENHVKKIVLPSSRSVYGKGVCNEENAPEPVSVYGLTKLNQEQLLKISSPVPYTILRLQNVYGPGQSLINPYTGLVSILYKRFIENKDVEVYDLNQATRDFVYVKDVVIALLLAAQTTHRGPYNIGTGKSTTILTVAEILKKLTGSQSNIKVTDTHRPGDVLQVKSFVDKANKELGFVAMTLLEEGLMNFVKSCQQK